MVLRDSENLTREEQNKLKPCWLIPLLQAKFYSICESHATKYTFFCINCMGLLLCEGCLNAKEHPAHQIIQVYKASHQVVIKTDVIHKLMDISCIQPYINNDSKVVYISQRRQKDQPSNNSNSIRKCETCGWQLLPGTTSKFCSIACKINGEGNLEKSFKSMNQSLHSYRKRSRKGIPRSLLSSRIFILFN